MKRLVGARDRHRLSSSRILAFHGACCSSLSLVDWCRRCGYWRHGGSDQAGLPWLSGQIAPPSRAVPPSESLEGETQAFGEGAESCGLGAAGPSPGLAGACRPGCGGCLEGIRLFIDDKAWSSGDTVGSPRLGLGPSLWAVPSHLAALLPSTSDLGASFGAAEACEVFGIDSCMGGALSFSDVNRWPEEVILASLGPCWECGPCGPFLAP
eukprot:scaffold38069_cov35-Prasinocladus_malaysianus.AAC.1